MKLSNRNNSSGKINYVFSVSTVNYKKLLNILFPLMSSKYLNYLDWEEVYNMILKKEPLKTEGKE